MKTFEKLNKNEMKMIIGGYYTEEGDGGSPKIEACKGKSIGDSCQWTYKGSEQTGTCRSYMAQEKHCSDLM